MDSVEVLLFAQRSTVVDAVRQALKLLPKAHLWQAVNLEEALTCLSRCPVSVVVLDLNICHPGEICSFAQPHDSTPFPPLIGIVWDHPESSTRSILEREPYQNFLCSLEPEQILATLMNTLRVHQSTQLLQETTGRYQSLINASQDAIFVHQKERVVYANSAAAGLFGVQGPEDLLGRSIYDLVHPAYCEITRERVQLLSSKVGQSLPVSEHVVVRQDGTPVHVEASASSFLYNGRPAIHVLFRDITRNLEAAKETRTSEQLYRQLIDNSDDSILACSVDGEIHFASRQTHEMHGFSDGNELIGRPLSELMAPIDQPRVAQALSRVVKQGRLRDHRYQLRRQDGTFFFAEMNASFLGEGFGHRNLVMINLRNISRRVKAEEELHQTRQLQHLVARIANGFINLPVGAFDETVQQSLKPIVQCLSGLSATIYQRNAENNYICTYYWAKHREKASAERQKIPPAVVERLMSQYGNKGTVQIVNLADWPTEFETLKAVLLTEGICSFVSIPLLVDQDIIGFLSFSWKEGDPALPVSCSIELESLAAVYASALARHKGQRALVNSKNRMRMFIDAVPQMIFARSKEGRFLFANRATAEAYGVDIKELIGTHLCDVSYDQDEAMDSLEEDRQILEQGEARLIEMKSFVDAAGDVRLLQLNKTPCQIPGTHEPAVLAVAADRTEWFQAETERKLARQEQRKGEKLLQTLMDTTPDGIFIKDKDCRYLYVNRTFAGFINKNADELLGHNDSELGCPKSLIYGEPSRGIQGLLADDHRVLKGNSVQNRVYVVPTDDGREIHQETFKVPLRDENGEVCGILGVARDITDLKNVRLALHSSEKTRLGILRAAPIGLGTIANQHLIWTNEAVLKMTGYSADELEGMPYEQLFLSEDEAKRATDCQTLTVEGGTCKTAEAVWLTKQGEHLHVILGFSLIDPQDQQQGLVFSAMDISEVKQARDRLRQSATVFESTIEGVVITDAQGKILDVNRAFSSITGYSRDDVLHQTPAVLKSGRHGEAFYRQMWQAIQQDGQWSGEIWNRNKKGNIYPEWLNITSVRADDDQTTHYVGVFSDISAIKESQAQLDYLSHHDPITELPNRLQLKARIDQALNRVSRNGEMVGLLFVGLDNFKRINDTLGHRQGDRVLQIVAERLVQCIRKDDIVARVGGDEFAVLLSGLIEGKMVDKIAHEAVALLKEPYEIEDDQVYLSASLGISLGPTDGEDAEELLKNAQSAMRRAKDKEHDRFEYYTSEMTRMAFERLMLEKNLRHAMGQGEFELWYQPQVEMDTGSLVGLEALVRWNSKGMGLVPPNRFIPLAEETGLIHELGRWVLFEACRQQARWRENDFPLVPVAVNLSAVQFKGGRVIDEVEEALTAVDIPAAMLELELTESMLMEDVESSVSVMEQLQKRGVRMAIDDFGTGYSSLSYLHRFPINRLKIDQSFVRRIHEKDASEAISTSIIALAQNLDVNVLAEGIESQAEAETLKDKGCLLGQGFYYHKPMPAEELALLLAEPCSTA